MFSASSKPVAFPVNVRVRDGDVVLRSSKDGLFSASTADESVSFEVECVDAALSDGWSILATDTLHEARDPGDLLQVQALGIKPWASGCRPSTSRIGVASLTGKRTKTVR